MDVFLARVAQSTQPKRATAAETSREHLNDLSHCLCGLLGHVCRANEHDLLWLLDNTFVSAGLCEAPGLQTGVPSELQRRDTLMASARRTVLADRRA